MANYHIGVKSRKRKAGVGNIKSATVSAKPFAAKATMPKAMPEKPFAVKAAMPKAMPEKPFAVKAAMPKAILEKPFAVKAAMPENAVVVRPDSIRGRGATARLVNTMDLDEMLEASKVVEMGIKGEKIPAVKSSKAQRYAGAILCLNRKNDTKPMAEKMMHDLNVQIIKVNKKTTDAVESRRLYRELMAEE